MNTKILWLVVVLVACACISYGQAFQPTANTPVREQAASLLQINDIPDVNIAPGTTSALIILDEYLAYSVINPEAIVWSFSGNSDVTVIYDGTSDPKTVAFTAMGDATETIVATAYELDPPFAEGFDEIIVRSGELVVSGKPDELVIAAGENINGLVDLDDWIAVSYFPDDQISWSYSGEMDLLVDIDQPGDNTVDLILPSDAEPVGNSVRSAVDQVITFEGEDPDLNSSSDTLKLKRVKNHLVGANYDFEWGINGSRPQGWQSSGVSYGGTNNTVTFGISDRAYSGGYSGRINISGQEGGEGITVASLVSDFRISYGGTEEIQIGDTVAIGMNIKRSQNQWFRIVFFRFGYGNIYIENIAANNTGPGTETGWEKYVQYVTLPPPAGDYYFRIENIATDAQLAAGDVELLVDNITLVNYGPEELKDTKVEGLPIGLANRYFNMGTESETTVVGVGSGTAVWSSTDMPVGWNIATAIDQYQNVDNGYPQYSVVDASDLRAVDETHPQAFQLVSKALDRNKVCAPAITTNVRINDGLNIVDPVDERSKRHVLNFQIGSEWIEGWRGGMFRVILASPDFSRSSEVIINSNFPLINRFRSFACHFAPQPWWPPSQIVPLAGPDDLIVRFDLINMLIGNVQHEEESMLLIDTAVLSAVQ